MSTNHPTPVEAVAQSYPERAAQTIAMISESGPEAIFYSRSCRAVARRADGDDQFFVDAEWRLSRAVSAEAVVAWELDWVLMVPAAAPSQSPTRESAITTAYNTATGGNSDDGICTPDDVLAAIRELYDTAFAEGANRGN